MSFEPVGRHDSKIIMIKHQLKGKRKNMYGTFIGDIVGSKYEFHNIKTKDFPLFSKECDAMYNPQLETFIKVADAGSFNKAAEESYITTTAVIKQINLLEDSLKRRPF